MIYLFNDVKELTGTVRNNHILNLLYEREKNGIYSVSAEIPVTYNDQGTIYNYNKKIQKSDFLGHYDKEGRFQLHKIAAVDIENGSIFVKGIHIFFDEAKAGAIIQDRRFVDREIIDGARVAFESIGWSVADFDVSVGKTYNFYNVTPLEARQILVETFGFEFDYWLDFDGKKVTNRHVAVKEKIGEKTNKRYTYGHNVLNIRAEQDYSEIYTAVIGRGKGEEIEETGGYGRRIEYTDVVWTTPSKPLNKPAGTRILEDPNATQLFGYKENGVVKPRVKVEVFSDIESPTELIQASYEWLTDNNVPKAVFSLKVADGDGLNLGDEVFVIYRDIDLIKSSRVEKVIDDLVSGNRDVEFGDTAYFDTDRRLSGLRADLKQYRSDQGGLIYALKKEFDRRFDEQIEAYRAEFEQAKIDIFAEIEADRQNMQNLLDNKSAEWTENFNQSVAESKDYAEQQAQAKAEAVRTDLEMVTNSHQTMLQELEDSVINIDDFLGDSRSVTLDERFLEANLEMEERIRNININAYNMLQGTRFDEPDKYSDAGGTRLLTTQNINRLRITNDNTTSTSSFMFSDPVKIESNVNYWLVVEYFSFNTTELDYLQLQLENGSYKTLRNADTGEEGFMNLQSDGNWRKAVIRINSSITLEGKLRMGSRWNKGTAGVWIDVRQPYLTNTTNREWLPHPNDATQSIEQITRRIYELEDGISDFITKTQYDIETGVIEQYIKSVEETVEGNQLVLQRVEDWQSTNGQSVLESVDAYQRKLWLNDFAEIGANTIPQSSSSWENGSYWSGGAINNSLPQNIRLKKDNSIRVAGDVTYTFSDRSNEASNIRSWMILQVDSGGQTVGDPLWCNRGNTISFNTLTNNIILTAYPVEGMNIEAHRFNALTKSIYVKLERGETATPMLNAISHIEQLADEISMQVQSLDGTFLKQTDFKLTPDYWQLGAMRIGAEDVSNVLRGSPDAIDAVVSEFNLTGNLNANGQITSLAVDAIEGNFARLFTNQLTANVITSDHIQVGTALVDKMFATSARIDELITKSHFVTNVKAMSIEAVEGQFSTLFTRYLSANYIDVDYINGKNAWFESLYTRNAMIAKLTAQTAFIRDIQAIEITANQLNIQTLQSKLGSVEGGLTIYGPDGRVLINNSMLRASFDVQVYDFYAGSLAGFNGSNFHTASSFWQAIKYFYTDFKGAQLLVSWAIGLQTGNSASEYAEVQVRGFGSNNPIGTRSTRQLVRAGETTFHNQIINLGVPDYSTIQGYLEIRRSPTGVHMDNRITARILRISLIN